MPNWNEILTQLQKESSIGPQDRVRREYISKLSTYTKRNVIAYYSGWLQKPNHLSSIIDDNDMNGLMTTVHQIDRSKGLDLLLHTPGGNISSIETIVDYLRKMFGNNIRVFIPQLAMSAGTMWACSCKEIIMGKQSRIGPIDPQFNGVSAEGVVEEFHRAIKDIKADPTSAHLWKQIISRYHPTFIGDCEKAIDWSKNMVGAWLINGMFYEDPKAKEKSSLIVESLSIHKETKSHNRQIAIDECKKIGLNVSEIEKDNELQDLVLSVHHSFMHTFSTTMAIKIIENQNKQAMVIFVPNIAFPQPTK